MNPSLSTPIRESGTHTASTNDGNTVVEEVTRDRWGATPSRTFDEDDDSSLEATLTVEEANDETSSEDELELMTLFLGRGRRLGCARYMSRTCRVESFEVSVLLGVEGGARESWGGRNAADNGVNAQNTLPILSEQDIPSSLLWLVQYVKVHKPLLFLPDRGAQPLEDIANLVQAKYAKLQATTSFDGNEALPRLRAMYPHLSATEIAGRFNLSNAAMLAALSALLHYTATVRCNVCDVVERAPLNVMYVERMTSQWLQITRMEQHPCDFQGIGRAKEGLSLFSTVNHAISTHGRCLLRQWFKLPSCDLAEIEQRQSVVRFFVAAERRDALKQLRQALLKVQPTNRIFTAMRSGKANLPLFQSLLRTVKAFITVYEVLLPFAHELDSLHSLVGTFDIRRLQCIARQVEANVYRATVAASKGGSCRARRHQQPASLNTGSTADDLAWVTYVDSGGLSGGRVSFHMGVDATLDQLRLLHTRLGITLSRKAEEAFHELSGPLRYGLTVRCVYAAPHGYLLSVDGGGLDEAVRSGLPLGCEASSPSFVPAEGVPAMVTAAQFLSERHGWQLQFTSPDPNAAGSRQCELYFFKNEAMLQLDAEVGNLLQRVRSREDHLRCLLEESLLKESLCLLQPAQGLAELDCLLGFAHCAIHRHWVCPHVVAAVKGGGALRIRGGWHPVLQQAMGGVNGGARAAAVANGAAGGAPLSAASSAAIASFDFSVESPGDRVSVVTGMSGSGKTSFLTAVAHIVFLAHLGSFVPASEATVGLTGRLFACSGIMDRGSFSSFEAECLTLNRIIQQCVAEKTEQMQWAQRRSNGEASEEAGQCAATTTTTTMVLMDDFGRGTCPKDATALLGATLRFFAGGPVFNTSPSCYRPVVLCSTHFTELFSDATTGVTCLPSEGGGQGRQRGQNLSFPFDSVAVYAMRCTAVYSDDGSGEGNDGCGASRERPLPRSGVKQTAVENALLTKRLRIPSDVIPSFEPTRLHDATAMRCGRYMWSEGLVVSADCRAGSNSTELACTAGAGIAVARSCGLDESAIGLWLKTLVTLHGEKREATTALATSTSTFDRFLH